MLSRLRQTCARFVALFRRDRFDRDLEEDLATHLELLTDDLVARGMDRATARREARLRFGSVGSATEIHRDVRAFRWIESTMQDLRYAARLLRRQPLLTCAIVLTLGIGIGAPTSALSLLNAMAFRVPASADPEAFFRVVRADRASGSGVATLQEYLALRDGSRSVRELAAWSRLSLRSPIGSDDPERAIGVLVSCNFFRVLGVNARVAGRLLVEDDCTSMAPVAVMSEGFWRRRFAGDGAIVGSSRSYAGASVTVIGVAAAPPFEQQVSDSYLVPDLWFPYSAHPTLKEGSELLALMLRHENHRAWELGGLLERGTSRETAEAELRVIDARSASSEHAPASRTDAIILTGGTKWENRPLQMATWFAMALALPALVMLMACVNVAALLLPRAVARQREMAVRLSLGTSKGRLVRMLLIESLLVSGLAVLVSLLLVYNLPPVLVRFFDAEGRFGAADALAPDWRVLVGLGIAGIAAALLSGLAPALESLNPRLADTLKTPRSLTARSSTSRVRRLFVGVQIGASMVLLIVAITFARTTMRIAEPGFRTDGLLVVDLRSQQKPALQLSAAADGVARAVGVGHVAYAELLPLVTETSLPVQIPGQPERVRPMAAEVSPGYFDVFDIPILAGRSLASQDAVAGGAVPVVVSRQFARRFFGDVSPLGKVIEELESGFRSTTVVSRMTIVGIAGDRDVGLSQITPALNDGSMIYRPIDPTSTSGVLIMATANDAAATADSVRKVLGELTAVPTAVRTFGSMLEARVVFAQRMQAVLLAMGIVSLLLAIIGVIGTVSAEANQRRKEFAIRSALGATPAQVRQRVMLSGVRPLPIALGLGLLASWGALKVAEAQRLLPLSSVAADPISYAAIAALLMIVTTATLLAVAYPAGRRDPVIALREE